MLCDCLVLTLISMKLGVLSHHCGSHLSPGPGESFLQVLFGGPLCSCCRISGKFTSQNSQRLASSLFWAFRNFLVLSYHIRLWRAKLRPSSAQLPLSSTCTLCECPSSHTVRGLKAERTVHQEASFRGLKEAKRQEHFLFPKYLPKNSTTQQVSFQGFGPWE